MGNPHDRLALVLSPPDDLVAEVVVYVLDGYFGSGRSLLNDPGAIGRSFAAELHEYQRQGLCPPAHFVFVDGSTFLGGSQYVNSLANGPFADHIVHEILPAIETTFSIQGLPRVVMGHSSGGIGALWLASEYPSIFQACLASAADSAFEYSVLSLFPAAAMRLARAGSLPAFLKDVFDRPQPERCSSADFKTLLVLALATCYSPQPGHNEIHAELPFDPKTLTLNESIWHQWLAHDPARFSDARLKSFKDLRLLLLDCGSDDEHAAQFGHRRLSSRLSDLGITHICEEFAGSHSGTRFRYRERLKHLKEALQRP